MGLSGRVSWSTFLHEKFATQQDRDAWIAEIYGPLDILYAGASVSEDDLNGTEVAAAPVVPGPGALPLTFFLTDDAGGRFNIDASTGAILLADRTLLSAAINPSHMVEVAVEDKNGLVVSNSLQITVTASQQGDPPILAFSEKVALREGDANGTVAGIVLVSQGVGDVTLSLQADPDGIFALNGSNGELSLNDSATFDTLVAGGQISFSATVRATDSADPANVVDLEITVEGVPTSYDPVAVHFEGVNEDHGVRAAALTNAVNSDALTVSFSFNLAELGTNRTIIWGWDNTLPFTMLAIRFQTTNELRIFAADAAGNTLLTLLSAPLTSTNEWRHCFFSCRDGATKKDIVFLIDGANALDTESVNVNGDIGTASATHWTFAAANNGPGSDFWYFNGGLVDFMLAQAFVANGSAFRDANGLLLNPGSDGSAALGSVPLLFFGGPDFSIGSPLTDRSGNGNDFTPVGSLTAFEPGPNDTPEEPSGNVVEAASLSQSAIQAAIDQATADGDIILLPSGDANHSSAMTVSSPFRIHIRGQDWLGSKAAYESAMSNLDDLAEVVHDATLSGSGRAAAWADYINAFDAFQPTTRGVRFTVGSDNLTFSRIEFDQFTTTTGEDYCTYWCRFTTVSNVSLRNSHLGGGLLAQCIMDRTVVLPTARVNASGAQSFWSNISVTPGGTDMPWVQDCHIRARAQTGQGGTANIDTSWHGGKCGVRRCVMSGGNGAIAPIRVHGYYRAGSNCDPQNSTRWLELHDILLVNDENLGWQGIEWAGGGGYINNFRDTFKGGIYVKYEAVSRSEACNPRCPAATSSYPNFGQTQGSGNQGLYINGLVHKGSPVTSENSGSFTKQCSNLFVEDRDFHFGPKPNYTPLGTHPFESRIVF